MLLRVSLPILLTALLSRATCQTIPTAMGYQIPDEILYESFFHRVLFLDGVVKRAGTPRGWDTLPPRQRIQRVVGLSDSETQTLLTTAQDWQARVAATDQAATEAAQTARAQEATSGAPSPATLQQLKSLQAKREQLALGCVAQLRAALGTNRFKVLDFYVRRTSTLKMVSVPPQKEP